MSLDPLRPNEQPLGPSVIAARSALGRPGPHPPKVHVDDEIYRLLGMNIWLMKTSELREVLEGLGVD